MSYPEPLWCQERALTQVRVWFQEQLVYPVREWSQGRAFHVQVQLWAFSLASRACPARGCFQGRV